MKYQLIAFDYDGTLVDTFHFHAKTIGKVVRDCGAVISDREMEGLIGKTLRSIFEQTLPEVKWERAQKHLCTFYKNIPEIYWKEMSLIGPVREVLKEMRERGIKTALVTNSHKVLVEASLKQFRLEKLFDWVEAADMDSYHKEERIRRMLRGLQIPEQKTLYVGDATGDMRDARETGMKSCLLLHPGAWIYREENGVKKVMSDYTVSEISELLRILS